MMVKSADKSGRLGLKDDDILLKPVIDFLYSNLNAIFPASKIQYNHVLRATRLLPFSAIYLWALEEIFVQMSNLVQKCLKEEEATYGLGGKACVQVRQIADAFGMTPKQQP